ncbi:MAG: hypothetical protein JZU50_15885 [Desulfobulbaceae bacterium]|nr:hypothetical protein [Desulfobulbaceae bacterium]
MASEGRFPAFTRHQRIHLAEHVNIKAEDLRRAINGDCAPGRENQNRPQGRRCRQELLEALTAAAGNQRQAAQSLGISRAIVWNRMKRWFALDPAPNSHQF